MNAPLLETRALVKRFGGLLATDHVSICVNGLQTHALIGPNGAGKSTLIGQLCGEILPDEGEILLGGEPITNAPVHVRARKGLGRSYQITQVCRDFSAIENVMMAAAGSELKANKHGRQTAFWRPFRQEKHLLAAAEHALETVGLMAAANSPVAAMAHGQLRQLELAMALSLDPKILLLDEPLAGMSSSESQVMVELLLKLKSRYPILLVEHDMSAVFALADQISVLVYGKVIAEGSPQQIKANPDVRSAYLGDEELVA